jgi:hypothetical protein
MGLDEAVTLSFKVLADWRVIFIALAIILAWAALRYVGLVYRKKQRRPPRPPKPRAPASTLPKTRQAAASLPEDNEEMIE